MTSSKSDVAGMTLIASASFYAGAMCAVSAYVHPDAWYVLATCALFFISGLFTCMVTYEVRA